MLEVLSSLCEHRVKQSHLVVIKLEQNKSSRSPRIKELSQQSHYDEDPTITVGGNTTCSERSESPLRASLTFAAVNKCNDGSSA